MGVSLFTCKTIHRHGRFYLTLETAYKEIDVLPLLSRSALDGVCQAILGYPSNTLDTGNDEYTEALRNIRYVV